MLWGSISSNGTPPAQNRRGAMGHALRARIGMTISSTPAGMSLSPVSTMSPTATSSCDTTVGMAAASEPSTGDAPRHGGGARGAQRAAVDPQQPLVAAARADQLTRDRVPSGWAISSNSLSPSRQQHGDVDRKAMLLSVSRSPCRALLKSRCSSPMRS